MNQSSLFSDILCEMATDVEPFLSNNMLLLWTTLAWQLETGQLEIKQVWPLFKTADIHPFVSILLWGFFFSCWQEVKLFLCTHKFIRVINFIWEVNNLLYNYSCSHSIDHLTKMYCMILRIFWYNCSLILHLPSSSIGYCLSVLLLVHILFPNHTLLSYDMFCFTPHYCFLYISLKQASLKTFAMLIHHVSSPPLQSIDHIVDLMFTTLACLQSGHDLFRDYK